MVFTRCAFSRSLTFCAVLLSTVITTSAFAVSGGPGSTGPKTGTAKAANTSLPLVFEENAGQSPKGSLFAGRAQAYSVQINPTSLNFTMAGKTSRRIAIDFAGAQAGQPAGITEAAFRTNYYIGNDPRKWHAGVRNYDRVALRGLYPGIDAEFYSHNGEIEHDFKVAAGADATKLAMNLSGAREVRLAANGDLMLDAEEGYLRLHKPVAYQVMADGTRKPVEASFHLAGEKKDAASLSFTLGEYDHARQLVIDPVITYATYVAGGAGSTPTGIVADAAGDVFLTGTTPSTISSFAAASTNGSANPAAGQMTSFVAEIAAGSGGSSIAWLSYFGSATLTATSNAIAINPAASTVYIGGTTPATDLPVTAGTFGATVNANGSTYGFVAALSTNNGHLQKATYIEATSSATAGGEITSVQALAATASGVVMGGVTMGKDLVVTGDALPVPTAVVTATALRKGFLVYLANNLKDENYGSYVAGDLSVAGDHTQVNGVAIDSNGKFYVGGSTFGDFPKSGKYGANGVFGPPPTSSTVNTFAAQIVEVAADTSTTPTTPAFSKLGYSYWSGGNKNDIPSGLTLDASGNLYVFGASASSDTPSKALVDTSYTASGTTLTALTTVAPSANGPNGFFSKIDATGQLNVTSFLGGDPAATSTTISGLAVDAAGNLYVSGGTDSLKNLFPNITSNAGASPNAPMLPGSPAPQDLTTDSSAGGNHGRAYVLQLGPTITAVGGLGYFGSPSSTTATLSKAVGVTLDGVASPNAYVLISDAPQAGAASFTTASAAQPSSQVADGTTPSAYVAQVAFAPAAPGSLVAGTNTYSPNPALYVASPLGFTTETITWQVQGALSGATDVVFNLPYNQYLKTYTLSMLKINGSAPPAGECTVGASSTANTQPGITCVLPSVPEGTTVSFTLKDDVTANLLTAIASASTTFSVPAQAWDAQGDSINLTQNIGISVVPTFTLTDTVNSASTATVNAATSTTDSTTPTTAVTYVYTIKNTSSADSPATMLTTNLGSSSSTFTQIGPGVSSTGCDPTTAVAGCDIPGGTTLTYTVTGVYLAGQFAGQPAYNTTTSAPIQYTSTTAAPTLTYTPSLPTSPQVAGTSLTVNINGNAVLSVAVSTSNATYNGGFELGDKNAAIKASISNTGIDTAAGATVSLTVPKGFTPTSSSASTGTGSTNCSTIPAAAPPALQVISCSFVNIATGNNTAVLTVLGTWSDTGTASDAVAPPSTSGGTIASVTTSATSGTVSATVPGLTVLANSTYVPPVAAASSSITVTRVNNLGLSLSAGGTTVNETNTHYTDSVLYTASFSNTGPSVARGIFFTFPIPVSATGTTATISGLSANTTGIDPANQLTCSSSAGVITCYSHDLTAVSTNSVATPAVLTYAVTFSATFPETTIPQTTVAGTTTATQGGGTFYGASVNSPTLSYEVPTNTAANPGTLTIQRSTQVMQTLALVPNIHAPAGYADATDLNLDEHVAGNAPGVNDSLTFSAATWNAGHDDAAAVSVTIPVPKYLLILSAIPSTCSIVGVAAPVYPYNTGATGATLTCSTLSATTDAGTYAQQLSANGAACTTNSVACIYVSFPAKFADAPSTATYLGAASTATVAPASAVATGNDFDPGTGLTSPTATPFGLQRAAHLSEVLSIAPQVHAPATFADTTDINLDEHVAGNAGGVNDQLIITSSTTNTGKNYALAVSVVVPLPRYLEIFSLPTGCVITGATSTVPSTTAPYVTSSSGGSLTCVIPPSVSPDTTNSVLQYSGVCAAATNAQCLYLNFLGKFVDANSAATVVAMNSTGLVTPLPAVVSGTFSDANTAQPPNTPAAFTVQRAAHLRLATTNPITATYTDNSALTLDGANPMIGQAAVSANALTRIVNSAGQVYNCIRYTVNVVNEGPNYTNSPTLNYAISQGPFTAALKTVGTAPALGPINCTISGSFGGSTAGSTPQALPIGSVAYGNGTQSIELDGYYGQSTLGGAGSALSAFSTSMFTTQDYKDSDTTGTTNKDFMSTKQVEVVNTPISNTASGGFTLTPNAALPGVNVIFTAVTSPGVTGAAISTAALTVSSAGGLLPAGKSPYPPDASAVKKLYQTGKNPMVYMLPSTAVAPTAVTNPTSVCIASATALPDLFVKPERTLLWALQNVPTGTSYNPMPTELTITPTALAPATGDITTAVTTNGTAYVVAPTITASSFPIAPQAQPSGVCGQVNGITTSTSAPLTLAALEPVNFPPYVVASSTSVSAQTGKGSTSAQTDIFLQFSPTQTTSALTFDPDDKDPCYIGGTRSACSDTPYLFAFVFGGGNTGTAPTPLLVSALGPEQNCNSGISCPNGKALLEANLSSGSLAYVAVADQATGADALNDYVVANGSYASNPYTNQGNFLTSNKAGGFSVCDPGVASGYYAITTKACIGTTQDPTAAISSEEYVPGGAGTNFTLGNVGAQQVTGAAGGGTGLIPLPYPALTSSPFTQVPLNPTVSGTLAPAIAYVTPGQTAGFIWNWLNGSVEQSSGATRYYYTLACTPVTSLTDATAVSLPTGTTCAISTSDPNAPTSKTFSSSSTNYAPTIYVTTTGNQFAKLNAPVWKYLGGGISLAMLLPLFAMRRRFRKGMVAGLMMLSLAVIPMLTGCGSSKTVSSTNPNLTPTGTYYFQVTATAQSGTTSPAAVYSAVFEVVVQPAN